MSLSLSNQKSLTDTTAAKLRTAIVEGELPLGTKLSEQMLADRFQISRSPVRDALAILQGEGLVTVYVKRGTYVFSPTLETISDRCEFRAVLECSALRLACGKDPNALNTSLKKVLIGMKSAQAAGDARQFGRQVSRFHEAIVQASQNQYLIETYGKVINPLRALRSALSLSTEDAPDATLDEHMQIAGLIGAGEVQRACDCLGVHANSLLHAYRAARAAGRAGW